MINKEWNDLLAFCATSAIGLMDEPQIYGPLRLLECMERLIGLGRECGRIGEGELMELESYIEENKLVCMYDEDEFRKVLSETAKRLMDATGL